MWNSQPFKWSTSLRCACRLSRIPPNSGSIMNTAFSRRWPASMLIYLNKRKHLYEKKVLLPQDWFRTPTWPPFHCFGTPIWPPWRHVKMLYKHICCSSFFISVNFGFPFVLNSLAYITIPQNNGKIKINCNKKLTTTYTLRLYMFKGLFTWRWGTPGRWGNPLRWDNPPVYILSLFNWSRLHDRSGDPPRRVARSTRPGYLLSRGQILPCKRFKVG